MTAAEADGLSDRGLRIGKKKGFRVLGCKGLRDFELKGFQGLRVACSGL